MFALSSSAGNGHVRNRYGYQGQERENTFALNLNEFEARHYDPQIGRWMVPDPANQFASPYVGMGNQWVSGVDPDGRWVHIAIGAAVGGAFNVLTHIDDIKREGWTAGVSAFAIGAVAGGIGAATGGAAFTFAGGGAAGAGGFLAGAASGSIGGVAAAAYQGPMNNMRFGDPYSSKDLLNAGVIGGLTGGLMNGALAYFNKGNFFNGTPSLAGKGNFSLTPNRDNYEWRQKFGPRKIIIVDEGEFGGVLDYKYPDGTIGFSPRFGGLSVNSQNSVPFSAGIFNSRGVPYLTVPVKGYGVVPFPKGPFTPYNNPILRPNFSYAFRQQFRAWWEAQGRPWPSPSPGSQIQIHHIKLLAHGGTNAFENLVPLDYRTQHILFNNWWSNFPRF